MRKILFIHLIISGLFYCTLGYSQDIPNAGFENWSTVELFESPYYWVSGNAEAIFSGAGFEQLTTERTDDSYSGDYALRLRSIDIDPSASTEIVFGYAISNAYLEFNDDEITYYGGCPVTANPDSIYGFFKYSIPTSDTAFILFTGKRNGDIVIEDFFRISGENETYTRLGFDIHDDTLTSPIDSFIIAITCSHILDEYEATVGGAYVIVDSLWFGGIDDTIPNSSFENWGMLRYEDPDDWWTTNAYHTVFYDTNMIATRSEDSHSGDYAMQLESRYVAGTDVILSYATTGFGVFQGEDRISLDFNPSMLRGYYKYDSPVSDQAIVVAVVFGETDSHGYYEQNFIITLPDAGEYTLFELPVTIPVNVTANGLVIHIMPGDVIFTSQDFEPGSVLLIDDLELVDPCDGVTVTEVFDEENTLVCEGSAAILDAGDEFDSYYWSSGETLQSISVINPGIYSVSATVNLCRITDEIEVISAICDEITAVPFKKAGLYPNPSDGKIVIELPALTGNCGMEIYDMAGNKYYDTQFKVNEDTKRVNFDLSHLKRGIYIVRLISDGQYFHKKLILN